MKDHLMAMGCSPEQAGMVSRLSEDQAAHLAAVDPTTRPWLLGLRDKFGEVAEKPIIASLPHFAKGDWKAAIEAMFGAGKAPEQPPAVMKPMPPAPMVSPPPPAPAPAPAPVVAPAPPPVVVAGPIASNPDGTKDATLPTAAPPS